MRHGRHAAEVLHDKLVRQQANDFVLDLQAVCDPSLSRTVPMPFWEGSTEIPLVEEKNIFCGVPSVLALSDKAFGHRVASISTTSLVTGGLDKSIVLWSRKTGQVGWLRGRTPRALQLACRLSYQRHLGSVRAL